MPARFNSAQIDGAGLAGAAAKADAQRSRSVAGAPGSQPAAEDRPAAVIPRWHLAAFAEIVGILMRSPFFSALQLEALERLVLPAVLMGQYSIARAQPVPGGPVVPTAVVLWATVSPEVDRRLSEDPAQRLRLAPKEWRSGDIPWLVLSAGDEQVVKDLIKELQDVALKGRPLKM